MKARTERRLDAIERQAAVVVEPDAARQAHEALLAVGIDLAQASDDVLDKADRLLLVWPTNTLVPEEAVKEMLR